MGDQMRVGGWMKTLVVQSYRTHDVAPWIADCMRTVREWAAVRGFAYEFLDDSFFDYAPAWVRRHCGKHVLPITDVARLYLLRERLSQDWDRVVWVDADVVVFDPGKFVFDDSAPYSLCSELTFQVKPESGVQIGEAINNAVMFFTRNHPLLDFWIFAAEEVLRASAPAQVNSLVVGTSFLSSLGEVVPLRVLQNVGLFVPPLIRDIAAGGGAWLDQWIRRLPQPIVAANLCLSMQDRHFSGAAVDAQDMRKAVQVLLETHGNVVNRQRNALAWQSMSVGQIAVKFA
jgi:hypothetical protein